MKPLRFFTPSPIHPIQMILFILIELLLVFGKEISKFNVIGPFYLVDVLLIILGLAAFIISARNKSLLWQKPIVILVTLGIIYLAYSLVLKLGPFNYTGRQFSIFLYLGICYLVFVSFKDSVHQSLYSYRFIVLVVLMSLVIQVIYLCYLWLTQEEFTLLAFNYFSPMVIMGVICANAYVLTHDMKLYQKIGLLMLTMFVTSTMGHASAFLSGFIIIGGFIFIKSKTSIKAVSLVTLVVTLIAFKIYLPQFSDYNSSWRLIFWEDQLKEFVFENYGIIGNGFGVPYADEELRAIMIEMVGSEWYLYRPEEKFTSPSHNSFLTIAFHVGLWSLILLILPLKKMFSYIFRRDSFKASSTSDFLVLSVLGLTVWSSFNVILELPHSSSFYWLIFFTTIYQLDTLEKGK